MQLGHGSSATHQLVAGDGNGAGTFVGFYLGAGDGGSLTPGTFQGKNVLSLADNTAVTGLTFSIGDVTDVGQGWFVSVTINGQEFTSASAVYTPGFDNGGGDEGYPTWNWAGRPAGLVADVGYPVTLK
jgi:hypothetical protein